MNRQNGSKLIDAATVADPRKTAAEAATVQASHVPDSNRLMRAEEQIDPRSRRRRVIARAKARKLNSNRLCGARRTD